MKTYFRLPVLLLGIVFAQCTGTAEVVPAVDYDQVSQELMQALAPQLVGTWTLRQVHVSFQRGAYYQAQIPIIRDTLFQDLATLTIRPAQTLRKSSPDKRYPEFEGTLLFRSKSYPVYFELRAHPDRVVQQQGPQALFMLETNFPVGSRIMEPEEQFLRNLGLLGDNYSLDLIDGQPTMIWRGLSRGVNRVELRK
ncbi:hypothetical protein [Hymenobacter sp. YC55]|uniref:hypothetical protein n=1 Tax=Hymenobacter sp. YC55 TaxID=3034019 RepID=UPI0023FA243D|nr:hypothetical protein [Hymenobacter sp. YC55]MDF7815220.1 hypothetical protein [Hymenobacter sp. YC55]